MTETPAKQLKHAIKVIKAAKKLGVISMKLGTLEFELGTNDPRESRASLKVSAKEIKRQVEKNQSQLDFDDAKDLLSTMHVEDPAGFEAALTDQELEDDDSLSGGDKLEETYSQ